MVKHKWVEIASLVVTIFFGIKGWITVQGIIDFISGLNPWKVSFFAFLAIFLGSLFINIRAKYMEFKKDYKKTRELVYGLSEESEKKAIKDESGPIFRPLF